jgi:hypothetical protein
MERRRKLYITLKNTNTKDWKKRLYELELDSLNKRIEYLEYATTDGVLPR